MRISDWSSDVCSSDLRDGGGRERLPCNEGKGQAVECSCDPAADGEYTKQHDNRGGDAHAGTSSVSPAQRRCRVWRSEEHTSELQSLMRPSYAVFCLKKPTKNNTQASTRRRPTTDTQCRRQ